MKILKPGYDMINLNMNRQKKKENRPGMRTYY